MGLVADRALVRELVDTAGGDTLDPFAIRLDKQYVFSRGDRAALAYRPLFGVALGSGGPVGASTHARDCLERFVALSEDRGLRPVVMLVREQSRALYHGLGFRTLYLGDEALLDVETFTLAGRPMRDVRQAVSRSRNFGISTEVVPEAAMPELLRQQLADVATRSRRGKRELGFSTALDEPFTVPYPTSIVVVCRDRQGTPIAFQRYATCCGGSCLSLDAMRREPTAPNGVNERMIVETVQWCRRNSVLELSLNFVGFRSLIENTNTTRRVIMSLAFRRINPLKLASLHRFSEKFRPRWAPRYLAYRRISDIPAVGLAALSAEGILPSRANPRNDRES